MIYKINQSIKVISVFKTFTVIRVWIYEQWAFYDQEKVSQNSCSLNPDLLSSIEILENHHFENFWVAKHH